jgi:hypothetical protein
VGASGPSKRGCLGIPLVSSPQRLPPLDGPFSGGRNKAMAPVLVDIKHPVRPSSCLLVSIAHRPGHVFYRPLSLCAFATGRSASSSAATGQDRGSLG